MYIHRGRLPVAALVATLATGLWGTCFDASAQDQFVKCRLRLSEGRVRDRQESFRSDGVRRADSHVVEQSNTVDGEKNDIFPARDLFQDLDFHEERIDLEMLPELVDGSGACVVVARGGREVTRFSEQDEAEGAVRRIALARLEQSLR